MSRRMTLLRLLFSLIIVFMLFVSACDKDNKKKPTIPSMDFGVVAGTVYSPGRAVLEGATVSVGDISDTTDSNGRFTLSGIDASDKVLVNFAMEGRASTQKVVDISEGRTSYVSATLFQVYEGTYSGTDEINIDATIALNIPAAAFMTTDGQAYTGTVRADVRYFDPTDPECLDTFPGNFSGIQTDGSTTMFESYGFVSASFRNASDPSQELQLAEGKEAELIAPIPYSLLENAPDTMPLWYYDEETGNWMEEGLASKVGSYYVGNVSHFSYWNFDHPVVVDDQATLTGKVTAADRDDPIAGAQVVATGVVYAGYTNTYTDENGDFSIVVKANSTVKLQAFSGTSASSMTGEIATPDGGQSAAVDDLVIQDRSFMIMGKMVDSEGEPVSGWGQVFQLNIPHGDMGFSAWLTIEEDGSFSVNASHYDNTTSFDIIFSLSMRGYLYSAAIPFVVPQPGNVWDFGEITMVPGGILTGRIQSDDGEYLGDKWVYFNTVDETGGEGGHFSAETDADGYFSIVGPPNTTLTRMKASIWENEANYVSDVLSLNFPASGGTSSIGIITVYYIGE
ncbi:MAG: carboxypeptidase-like regulatory domain-containing protein [Candidatus Cloacimonetes bacterium]|nr:carboxypeptidase-like regulatory domain-containing protein [Candidatus Cloacimonadota bacterium]MDD4559940.1 carboxypeptidase-like regulatory domain-containing protein [Candidatus Cloacimonadota bacterium]